MDLETAVCYLCQSPVANIDDVEEMQEEDLICAGCMKEIFHDYLTDTSLEEDLCDDDPDHDVDYEEATA